MLARKAMMRFYKELETMALTEGDKAMCAEIAREIIEAVIDRHIESCPHGIALKVNKKSAAMFIVGVCIGSGFAGGSLVLAIAKILML